ncbi:Ig-like domain-containing protein [Vibrio campbellii]|uniref:Ig-like domain-containing protein n=1 Tax=Vibrio campbellii TaxID=680 RepID=UPI00131550BF|nr:Ig-like domain-containing protein [Vibrio campbellii]
MAPENMDNLAFKFSSTKVGEHIVSYIISDHFGGYANGLVRIEVTDPSKVPPWGNITMDDKLFWGPLTKSQADAKGIEFTGTNYEKEAVVATSVISQAQQQCKPLGRLPTPEEMHQLSEIKAGDVGAYNWPIEVGYYAKIGSQVKVIDISRGNEITANAEGQYVTCVTEGGFVVDESKSDLYAIANGTDEAKVVVKVTAGGTPVPDVSVFAEAQKGATLKNSEAQTDEDGLASFSLVSLVAGSTEVVLSMDELEATPTATVRFVADETTASLSLETETDWQDSDGGINEVVAALVDANGNPIFDRPIQFNSFDTINIKPKSVTTNTNGEITAEVTWDGESFLEDVEAKVFGTYTTTLDQKIGDSTTVHFKGSNYRVESVYQKQQGTTDTHAYVCALVTKDGVQASEVKVLWSSSESWAAPIDSETESNGLGEACTEINLLDPAHHSEPVDITARIGSSQAKTSIMFSDDLTSRIWVKLYEGGSDISPAKVVANIVDDVGQPVSNKAIKWSSSVSWVEMRNETSLTDDDGNAYNEISILDSDYLGTPVTIFGEYAAQSGSTTFVFNDNSMPQVTIANMHVEIPGGRDSAALICADVLGLDTVKEDYIDGDTGQKMYYVDWSAEPSWVTIEGEKRQASSADGYVCNSFKLNDSTQLYQYATATLKFRNLSNSNLVFWFWDKDITGGSWIDDLTKKEYYQVPVDPNKWLTNKDKNRECKAAGYTSAVAWNPERVELRPVTSAFWSKQYYTSFTGNLFATKHDTLHAGIGQGSPLDVLEVRDSFIVKGNVLTTLTDRSPGGICIFCKVQTKSNFVLCE